MWLQRERKDDVIRSDLELGSHLELNAILFQSWSKIRSNSKLPSIIITNISQSSPHTTSWFTEDINILRLTFKVCSLMCTSWSSVNQISNFKFSAFFRFLFALWSLKYTHPKSQQTPRVSTELEIVVNFSYSFIPLKKVLQKGVDRPVENPRKSAENIKMMPNAPNKFYRRTRRQNAPLLEFSIWRTAIPSDWYSITQAQYGKCAKCTKCVGVLCQTDLHPCHLFEIVVKGWSKGLQEEANLKPSDSALRSSTNEPRWFHRDLGLSRIYKKVSIAQLKTCGRALRISKWCRTLLEFSISRTAFPSDWYSITQAQYGKCAKCTKCMGVLCQTNLHSIIPLFSN